MPYLVDDSTINQYPHATFHTEIAIPEDQISEAFHMLEINQVFTAAYAEPNYCNLAIINGIITDSALKDYEIILGQRYNLPIQRRELLNAQKLLNAQTVYLQN